MKNKLIFLFIFSLIVTILADWPVEFTVSDSLDTSLAVPVFNLKQINGRNTYNTDNSILLLKVDSVKKIMQGINYSFYDDFPLSKKKHYLNFGGEFLRKEFPFSFSSLGLEWSPSLLIDKYRDGGITVGAFRTGPKIKLRYNSLPVTVSGGLAFDAVKTWKDTVIIGDDSIILSNRDTIELVNRDSDAGGYVSLKIGNNKRPLIEGVPFYAEGEILGTYMSNSNITSGMIDGLFLKTLNLNNEIAIYVADTLTKGRKANYSENSFGSVDYNSSYDRTENNFKGLLGYRRINGSLFSPGIVYSVDINTMNYPYGEGDLNEYRYLYNNASFILDNTQTDILEYSGRMNFQIISYDFLYRNKVDSKGLTGVNNFSVPDERYDSLAANERDMEGRFVELYNNITLNILSRSSFGYQMLLDRYRKVFPNVYIYPDGRETVRYDRDEISYKHSFIFDFNITEKLYWNVIFDYAKISDIYLKSEKSASNTILRKYELSSNLILEKENGSYLKEELGISNDQQAFPDYVRDFLEKEFAAGNDQVYRPFNNRKIFSRFDFNLRINEYLGFSGFWHETYFDDGFWDIETWKSEYDLGTGRYIIENRNIETELMGAITLYPVKYHKYKFGVDISNIISYYYDLGDESKPGKWIQDKDNDGMNDFKYDIKFNPFLEFIILLRDKFILRGNIKLNSIIELETYDWKTGDTGLSLSKPKKEFWEAGTSLEVKF